MMKKFLFITLLFAPLFSYSQDQKVTLLWEESDSLFYFNDAAFQMETGNLPIYSKVMPWSDPNMLPVVSIKVLKASPLHEKFHYIIKNKELSNAPGITYELVYEKKQPRLQLMVIPFYIDESTGTINYVESFSLIINKEYLIAPVKALKKGDFGTNSVLSGQQWFKIAVTTSGIHKLTFEQLEEIGLSNPAKMRIYGAGAILLPEDYTKGSYDDLKEVPYYINKGSDQLFGPGDYILFYAQGPIEWNYNTSDDFYSQQVHYYANRGYYFLTDGMGPPTSPKSVEMSIDPADYTGSEYDIITFYEMDKYNLISSGREWYGDNFSINLSATYPFTLKNLVYSEPVKIRVTAAGRSGSASSMSIKANNTTIGSLSFNPVSLSQHTALYAHENEVQLNYTASKEIITIELTYNQPDVNSEAWLNHITINGRASMIMEGDEFHFRDSRTVNPGAVTEFILEEVDQNTIIWDITNTGLPGKVDYTLNGSAAHFRLPTDELREFIAFRNDGDFPSPQITGSGLGKIENQNLHNTSPSDMIIIYPEELKEQAERLAEHRRSHDQLKVLTVTQEMIFNEFSSGTPNVSAIRNYLKMYYDRYSTDEMVKYLLLFGDGTYDNRDTGSYNPNMILTYQSTNSLQPTYSYVSDDFYGLLDSGEGLNEGSLDIGIGRLTISSPEMAEAMVDKLIAYDRFATAGEWRNFICFIGDDEDGNIHMKQADGLAEYVESNYPGYNINKIFLDAYPQVTSSAGDRYPDVNRLLTDQVNRGALIINYTGHGGVTGLAHERIVEIPEIKKWTNEGKWPLFMTATCEFSRYDDYDQTKKLDIVSPGEEVLLNEIGGGIALFTTTRLVYSAPNHDLNEEFYKIVFEKNNEGNYYRLGDIIRESKNNVGYGLNKRNFTLLGDPATLLSFPINHVITDSVNHVAVENLNDSISALDFVTISGHIENSESKLLTDFNGKIIPIVYDKETKLTTLGNDGGSTIDFQLRNNILYKGNATVKEGQFSFSFYVPKDISFNYGEGKICYYAYSDTTDANGASFDIVIGGINTSVELDTIGPEIAVYMNDTLFRNGGIVTSSPELLIHIKDPYGVNTTGTSIGHDITAVLDENTMGMIVLNEYYTSDIDSYESGYVRYPYYDLSTGKHTVEVKVWDIFNNSAKESLDFVVVESMEMLLENIYNYPNPFYYETWFNIEHNRPGKNLDVVIRIYDIQGNICGIIDEQVYSDGFRVNPIHWNGRSYSGATLGGGIYVYKVFVQNEDGEEAVGSGRLVINR